jgi:hypothetical protein
MPKTSCCTFENEMALNTDVESKKQANIQTSNASRTGKVPTMLSPQGRYRYRNGISCRRADEKKAALEKCQDDHLQLKMPVDTVGYAHQIELKEDRRQSSKLE